MAQSLTTTPKWSNLIDCLYDNQLVIFAGAGCSADVGIPTGRKLAKVLCEKWYEANGNDPEPFCSSENLCLEEIAEEIATNGKKSYIYQYAGFENWKWIKIKKNGFHVKIANLIKENCFRDIITTNYDCLFESAFAPRDIKYHRLIIRGDSENIPSCDHKLVYKVYGCLSRPRRKWDDEIIITKSDLESWGSVEKSDWFLEAFNTLLRQRRFLVVGFSGFLSKLRDNVFKVVSELYRPDDQFFWIGRQPSPDANLQMFFDSFSDINTDDIYFQIDNLDNFISEAQNAIFNKFLTECESNILNGLYSLSNGIIVEEAILNSWNEVKNRLLEIMNDKFNDYFRLFEDDAAPYSPLRTNQGKFEDFLRIFTLIYSFLKEVQSTYQLEVNIFQHFCPLEIKVKSDNFHVIKNMFFYHAQLKRKSDVPGAFNAILNSEIRKVDKMNPFDAQRYKDQNESIVIVRDSAETINKPENLSTPYSDIDLLFKFVSFRKIMDKIGEGTLDQAIKDLLNI